MSLPDNVNIDCQFQRETMKYLECKVASFRPRNSTNKVDDEVCFKCEIGKIYRELGCIYIAGETTILTSRSFERIDEELMFTDASLWCSLRKRKTSYNNCLACSYVGSEFTRPKIKEAIDFFKKLGFESARNSLKKAQDKLYNDPENAITNSITAIESVFKSILDKLEISYPQKETITALWKSIKDNLNLGDEISSKHTTQLIGNLSGAISSLGGMRNDLSDAHGKGLITPEIYESYAELAVNMAAIISLFVIRRYQEKYNE